jgi:hypothetical protein
MANVRSLAGIPDQFVANAARTLVVRCFIHVANAVDAAGGNAASLRSNVAWPSDLEMWALTLLDDGLPAAFIACGLDDGARAMAVGARRVRERERELTIEESLLVLSLWLDTVAGQVQSAAQEQGFSATGLVYSSLWSTLRAVRDIFAGRSDEALDHVCDAARAAPSLRRARQPVGALHPQVFMLECMDAGTEGAIAERQAHQELLRSFYD